MDFDAARYSCRVRAVMQMAAIRALESGLPLICCIKSSLSFDYRLIIVCALFAAHSRASWRTYVPTEVPSHTPSLVPTTLALHPSNSSGNMSLSFSSAPSSAPVNAFSVPDDAPFMNCSTVEPALYDLFFDDCLRFFNVWLPVGR